MWIIKENTDEIQAYYLLAAQCPFKVYIPDGQTHDKVALHSPPVEVQLWSMHDRPSTVKQRMTYSVNIYT